MAGMIPKLSDHLLNIRDNILDLLPIFKNQFYYVKDMKGSASIKFVLPALYPNDESLNYHNLDQVHKGDEASAAYLSLKDLLEAKKEGCDSISVGGWDYDECSCWDYYDDMKEEEDDEDEDED